MSISTPRSFTKATIVPLYYCGAMLEKHLPYRVLQNVEVQSVKGLLKPGNFELWKEYLSPRQRTGLASLRFGLVNEFVSGGLVGREEKDSQDLLHKVFVCLRLIKPTRMTFGVIQWKRLDTNEVDVFSFSHPSENEAIVPKSEVLNTVTERDLSRLRSTVATFLEMMQSGPSHLRRAIRFYEEGYSDIRDPVVQIIVWVMGLQAAMTEDGEALSREKLLERVHELIGSKSDIFEDSWLRDEGNSLRLTVGEAVFDLFKLYDSFVGGSWVPTEWKERKIYLSPLGEEVEYADILRGAASYLLRRSILRLLSSPTEDGRKPV